MKTRINPAVRSKIKAQATPKRNLNKTAFEPTFDRFQFGRQLNVLEEMSISRLESIFGIAQTGELGFAVDLYRRIEASDARLHGLIAQRREAVTSSDYEIAAASDSPFDQDVAAFVRDNLWKLRVDKILERAMNAKLYGVDIAEKIYNYSPENLFAGNAYIKSIQSIDVHRVEMNMMNQLDDDYGKLYLKNARTGIKEVKIEDLPAYKIAVATSLDERAFYDLGAVMRPVAKWYILKAFIIAAWAQFAELYGFPVPIVKVNTAFYAENKDTIKEMLETVGLQRYGIFFDEMEHEFHDSNKQATVAVFSDLINLCNTEMAIAITGQNLSSEVSGGSFAAATTHKDILMSFVAADLRFCNEYVNTQIIEPLVKINYPQVSASAMPEFKATIKAAINRSEVARGIKEAASLVEIEKSFVYDSLQIPAPSDDAVSQGNVIGGYRQSLMSALDIS